MFGKRKFKKNQKRKLPFEGMVETLGGWITVPVVLSVQQKWHATAMITHKQLDQWCHQPQHRLLFQRVWNRISFSWRFSFACMLSFVVCNYYLIRVYKLYKIFKLWHSDQAFLILHIYLFFCLKCYLNIIKLVSFNIFAQTGCSLQFKVNVFVLMFEKDKK